MMNPDSDKMDVDPTSLGGLSASSYGSSDLHTEGVNLDTLNVNMKHKAYLSTWQRNLDESDIEGDDWLQFIAAALRALTKELATTELRSRVITSLSAKDALSMIQGCSKEELRQLKDGVRSGLEKNDWGDLIKHRAYILDYRMVG